MDADRAPASFHARKSARSKLYRYLLDTGGVAAAPEAAHAWPTSPGPSTSRRWSAAARIYVGRHDFASLASSGGSVTTTERTVTRSDARFVPRRDGVHGERTLVYEVEADGFLRKMVRSMVGGLLAVGRGALSVEDLRASAGGPRPPELAGARAGARPHPRARRLSAGRRGPEEHFRGPVLPLAFRGRPHR